MNRLDTRKDGAHPQPNSDTGAILAHLQTVGGGLSYVVTRFSSCLGVPRHASNDSDIVTATLVNIGVRHDRLLYLA